MYAPMPSETERGIRHVSNAMLLFLIMNVILVIVILAIFPVLASAAFTTPDPGALGGILGALIAIIAALCVLFIIGIIGAIFGLLGLIGVNKGKHEFGPEHSQKVDRALVMIIIGIIIPAFGGAGAGLFVSGGGGLTPSVDYTSTAISLATGAAGALLVGLGLLWMIERIATPQGRTLGMWALILGIAASVVGSLIGIAVVATQGVPTDVADFSFMYFAGGIIGYAISVTSIALWYTTYRGVLMRFRRGELRAMAPAYPAYAQPASPYPPPYYPPYPGQPPQQGPPPGQQPPPGG